MIPDDAVNRYFLTLLPVPAGCGRCEEPERCDWDPCVPGLSVGLLHASLGRASRVRHRPGGTPHRQAGRADTGECRRSRDPGSVPGVRTDTAAQSALWAAPRRRRSALTDGHTDRHTHGMNRMSLLTRWGSQLLFSEGKSQLPGTHWRLVHIQTAYDTTWKYCIVRDLTDWTSDMTCGRILTMCNGQVMTVIVMPLVPVAPCLSNVQVYT